MKKCLSVFLVGIMVFTMIFTTAPRVISASEISELYYGSGPIRSMTTRKDGVVIGGRSSGHAIEVWSSSNKGTSWSRIGTVASNDNINYGDVMFLAVPQTDTIFCAFREKNASNQYAVVICRSDNGGYDWVYDSTVIAGCSQFVGAPWLFIAQNGDLQCYYDSEPLATQNGVSGAQWIAMQGRNGLTGSWDKYGVVAASRDANASKFVRDGMASVVDLGNNRIMVVTEGIEDDRSGGVYSNVVRAIQSFDGGRTWNYSGRKIVYESKIDSASGRRYNAYCPMAIRVGNGPVGVVFCTDEDFGGTPDASSEVVSKRRTHIKYIKTLNNFETWGDLTPIWTDGSGAYAPGMIETASNEVLISIDHFSGNQRFYQMDVLGKGGENMQPNIKGKTFFFLGSSVTYGYASGGVSFVDYIAQRNGCTCVKEAVSGTTLVDNGSTSYIQRMLKNLDSTAECDHFICQLSTNDASKNLPLGSISNSYNSSDFDKSTIIGAMEYIISYAKNTWDCPVTFYTNTYYNSPNYQAMVDALYKLQEKWHIGIIDLWNNESMRNVSASDYARYMADNIHPTATGYKEWWTPVFENYLQNFDYSDYTHSSEQAVIPGTGSLLYHNDFTNSNGLQYYPGLVSGSPVYSNHTLTINDGNSNKIVVSDKSFDDFVVEADIRVKEDSSKNSNQGGIIFRVNNPYSGVSDGYDGYYFGIDALKNEAILGKVHQNQWVEIAKKKMTVEYNKYYHVSVAVSGNEIKGYVNYNGKNYAKIVAVDNDFSSGTVGFRHWLAGASFKNLKVSAYKPEVPDKTYTNSVLNSCADPDVLYHNGVYYMYATNTENANQGFKVYSSVDLVNWTDRGWALSKDDVYGDSGFWAPDLIEKDGIFYMYYVANEHLSVATSDSPLGPFKQRADERKPMHEGKEIDAHVFKDDDGQYYIYFVRFYGKNGVADGNYIYGAKLNADMKTMDDSTITCLISPEESWETNKAKVVEGPFMLKKDGVYYLTYSGSHFESDYYGSGYATGTSPLGIYSKYENNPIMQSNTLVHGAGHHGIVATPDGSEMFIVYHCHSNLTTTEPRRLCIDRIHFTEDDYGKTVLEVYGPTITPQEMPQGTKTIDGGIEINGYQISATIGGMRTVYSVDSVINGKEVVSSGMLYSLADYVQEKDFYVGSTNKYVKSFESTGQGLLTEKVSDSNIASSYAMTVKFTSKQPAEYSEKWKVKAYAELSDGSYVYTDAKTYSAYEVADILYQGSLMNNQNSHEYLYTNILSIVNQGYSKIDYKGTAYISAGNK
ncbi:family 43 glycosylhydrolase [uncultured Eubacterium sp.]|uniref:family 43 glycosylhydrolase n=1 Tax=uncultured Eubacterium sp. TaxID=165185 RepID=UPI0026735A41|nr:family 43 glycosylhydrolase [uncultured Eubacterium sp.]